jgi:hypothetical protein
MLRHECIIFAAENRSFPDVSPPKKDMLRIVTGDAVGRQRRMCKFVAGRYSPSTQRRANERCSNASDKDFDRPPWPDTMVNEAAGGTIEWSWHPLFAPPGELLRTRPGFD